MQRDYQWLDLAQDLHIDVNETGAPERARFNAMRRSNQKPAEQNRERRRGASRVKSDRIIRPRDNWRRDASREGRLRRNRRDGRIGLDVYLLAVSAMRLANIYIGAFSVSGAVRRHRIINS